MNTVQSTINSAVEWLRLGIETIGVAIIALGVVLAVIGVARELLAQKDSNFNPVRLQLARFLALGLEFQLGADILSTAIAPSWDEIGKLAAIAAIRTGLNYFLMQEMQHERAMMTDETSASERAQNSQSPIVS